MTNKVINDEELDSVNGGLFNLSRPGQKTNNTTTNPSSTTPSSSCDKFEKKLGGGPLMICSNCKYFASMGGQSGVCNNTNKGPKTDNI